MDTIEGLRQLEDVVRSNAHRNCTGVKCAECRKEVLDTLVAPATERVREGAAIIRQRSTQPTKDNQL